MFYCKKPRVAKLNQAHGEACNVVGLIKMPALWEEGLFLVISLLYRNAFFNNSLIEVGVTARKILQFKIYGSKCFLYLQNCVMITRI